MVYSRKGKWCHLGSVSQDMFVNASFWPHKANCRVWHFPQPSSYHRNAHNTFQRHRHLVSAVIDLLLIWLKSIYLQRLSDRNETHMKYEERNCSRGILPEEAREKGGEIGIAQGRAVCWEAGCCTAGEVQGALVPWKPQQRTGIQVLLCLLIFSLTTIVGPEVELYTFHNIYIQLNFDVYRQSWDWNCLCVRCRCIRVNRFHRQDPDLLRACRESGVQYSDLGLPLELTLWVDPGEVCCRWDFWVYLAWIAETNKVRKVNW